MTYRPEGTTTRTGYVLAAFPHDRHNMRVLGVFADGQDAEHLTFRMPRETWDICRTFALSPSEVRFTWYDVREYDERVSYLTSFTPVVAPCNEDMA